MGEMRHRWHNVPKGKRIVCMVFVGLIAAVFFGFFFGYFVMLLWNWLMPYLFNLKTVTYWQAFGIVILSHLIFGSHRMGPGHGSRRVRGKRLYHEDENEDMRREWSNWRYYDQWWDMEGKKAFEDYVGRRNGERANAQEHASSKDNAANGD